MLTATDVPHEKQKGNSTRTMVQQKGKPPTNQPLLFSNALDWRYMPKLQSCPNKTPKRKENIQNNNK